MSNQFIYIQKQPCLVLQTKNLKHSMQKFTQVNLSDEYLVNMRSVLGKGSTGSVFQGRDLRTNQMVAVKVIELSTIDNEVTQYLLKMQKIALMILSSSYVLRGLKILQDEKYCFMVTQYCNGGTLKKYIKESGCLSEQKSLKIIKQLLQGYKNLVEKKVVHRDLKPANIMIHNDSPKIIDFGYCQIEGYKKPHLEYNVGSPSYMAPQSYQFNIYNQKTQIWSIGVILYQCLTGKTLDEGRKMTEIYQLIKTHGVKYPDNFSKLSKQIIGWCLKINPSKRPTCSELLSKYFSNSEKNDTRINKQNFIEEQSYKTQKSISTLTSYPSKIFQTLNSYDKKSIYGQNKLKEQEINHYPQQKMFGTLANMYHHQSINNKYVQNRLRPVFSSYQPAKMHDINQYQLGQQHGYRKNSIQQRIENTKLVPNIGQLVKQQKQSIMKKSMIPLYNPQIGIHRNLNTNKYWQKSENLKRNSVPNQMITNCHKIMLNPSFVSHPHLNRNQGPNNLNIFTERQRVTSYRV